MTSNEDNLRSRVYEFYSENLSSGKSFTVKHFMKEKIPQRTIYDILKRYERGLSAFRQSGSGRVAKIFTRKKIGNLKKDFDHKDRISQRQAAKKYKCSQSMINYVLKKAKISCRKKKTIPQRNEKQQISAKTKCGRLYRKFSKRSWILDDESYFTLSNSSINGNNRFYSSNISDTPPDVKYSTKKKFESKVLVWIAIGPKGMSKPFIRSSNMAINQDVYLEECIKKRLIPYIRANYQRNYIFWPDLASSHYAKKVTNYLLQESIDFVVKEDNPANVPEARSIEDFWSILKGKVYAKAWRAENVDQLVNRIRYCIKQINLDLVQKLAVDTKKRIDYIRRNGVIEQR